MKILTGYRFYFPKYSGFVLIALILLMSFIYDYHKIITKRPQGPHQWRQTDCLSMTASYYYGDTDFLHPRIYHLLNDNEGKTVSEFPIINYTIALLWKVFGKHEWIYRLFNFLLSIIGMYVMFRLIEKRLQDSFWSIWAVLLLFTSVIYIYYSLNFLPNTAAFNMILIGWHFFHRYESKGKEHALYFMFLFFLIGGLLKMSSVISFIAISMIFFLEWTGMIRFRSDRRIFPRPLKFILPAFLIIMVWSLWIIHAKAYNSITNSNVFLLGILPIWELDHGRISDIIDSIRIVMIKEYYYPITQALYVGMLGMILLFVRKTDYLLFTITVLLSIAFTSVIILWFSALQYHDYYVIDLLILSVFILLTFLHFILSNKKLSIWMHSYLIKVIAVAFLVLNIIYADNRSGLRYKSGMNNRHLQQFYGYEDIEPYLDSIGIGREQKFIAAQDPTINATLYLMNRKGWSQYGTNMKDSLVIVNKINMGARWLTLHNDMQKEEYSFWNSFIKEQVGQHKNVKIYRIGLPEAD